MAKAPIKELLFGRLALAGRLITEEQIAECLELQHRYEEQGGSVPRLGELLAMKGFMTADQVKAVLEGQHSRREGLFGEIALRWRLITPQDLEQALETQREQDRAGKHRARLGEILVERGLLRPHQVRAVLDAQGKRIVHCSACNARFNVAQFRAGARLVCAKCGATTVLGETERHVADSTPLDVQNTVWIAESEAAAAGEGPGSGVFPGAGDEGSGTGSHTAVQIGGFEIISRLGSDGVSHLCKARSLSTGDLVTLKVMRPSGAVGDKFLQTFRDGSKQAVYLDHPNLKRVYEVGADRGRYFVAEEYVAGKSLKRHLEMVGRMTPAEAVDCASQIAEALAYGHGRSIVHGDVRPSNVVIDQEGRARLSGLGVAKDAVLTLNYLSKGAPNTPFYLAPEAAVDPARADARSDVYSLGACLYHMTTGRPPYVGQGSLEVLMRLTQEEPVPPEQIDPELPPELCALIMKMLSAEPDERPQTMAGVLATLKAVAAKLGPASLRLPENTGTNLATSMGMGSPGAAPRGAGRGHAASARPVHGSRHANFVERRPAHLRAPHGSGGGNVGLNLFLAAAVALIAGGAIWVVVQSGGDNRKPTPRPTGNAGATRRTPRTEPAPDGHGDPAAEPYGLAVRYAEGNVGDDAVIAAKFKDVADRYPNSKYNRWASERYLKHISLAAGRALDTIERGRGAAEARGDFKSGLAAVENWRREHPNVSEEVASRGDRLRGAIAAAQRSYLEGRFNEADALAAAGKYAEARGELARLGELLSQEGSESVAVKLKELENREVATADAATRTRLEAERAKREEEERRSREAKLQRLAERAGGLRAEVGELIGHRDFAKARETLAGFRADAAGTGYFASAAELEEVAGLCADFHQAVLAGIGAGRADALIRFDGRPRQAVAADDQTVTLDLGGNVNTKLRWDSFAGRDICEMARGFVPRDNPRMTLAYAVYAAALGQDAEAARYLELAEAGGVKSAAARAAIEGNWLLDARERRRRSDEAARVAAHLEDLRGEAAAAVGEWNLPRAAELFAKARQELAGTANETAMTQAEESVALLAEFHSGLVAALKAHKGNPSVKYAGQPRRIGTADSTGVTVDMDGIPIRLPWDMISRDELYGLAIKQADPKSGKSLAGCAIFLDLVGDRRHARSALELAGKAGLSTEAPRAAIDGRLLLTSEEKQRRAEEDRQNLERFEKLRGEAAAAAAAGELDKAVGLLAGARASWTGTGLEGRFAQIEEAMTLAFAFNKVFMAGLKSGRGAPRLRYGGQLRRVMAGGPAGVTLDVEGQPVKLAWTVFPGKDICALARGYADPKDGASLLGCALLCSIHGEAEEAGRLLEAAEKVDVRSVGARAAIEGRWLAPPGR